ncbi:hypothetical protein AH85_14405 [Salmonella enterica subsp. enterica serovar Tennessee]|nr:hypothetical protein AH85_14405 [Salmonella enterica subsp. enterica serovar Tennessee]
MLAVSYWRGKRHNHQDSSFSTILVQLLAPASSLTSTETGAKKASIEKDGKKISLENITHYEMAKFLEDAKTVVFREDDDKKPT